MAEDITNGSKADLKNQEPVQKAELTADATTESTAEVTTEATTEAIVDATTEATAKAVTETEKVDVVSTALSEIQALIKEIAHFLMNDQGVKTIYHNPILNHWYTNELYAKDACKDYVTYHKDAE